MTTRTLTCWLLALLFAFSTGCRKPSWDDPEFFGDQIRNGSEQALRKAQQADSEMQVQLIPAMTDAYNSGLFTTEVVQLLVDIGHVDGIPVLESALESEDNRLAGLAARGLAGAGANSHIGAIAARLRRVRDPNQYEPFLDALRGMDGGDASVAPAIAEIITRPAGSVGGINTIRFGCTILGRSGATDEDTVKAILFGLINFDGNQMATNECALALVTLGAPAIPHVLEVLNHGNGTINTYLSQSSFTPEVAGLRAARVLADMGDRATLEGLTAWFTSEHQVNVEQLAAMSIEAAQNWHQNFGQQFTFAVEALEYLAEPTEEDPTHLLLRGLIARGEGMALENFRWFMGTSVDAELGLRSAAIDSLVNVGDPADRDAIFAIATEGTLARIPDTFIRKHAAHAFVLLAQPGDAIRYDELINGVEEGPLVADLQQYRAAIAQVADGCAHDLDCLTGLLRDDNQWVREKAAFDLAHFVENERAAAAALLDAIPEVDDATKFTYIRQLRHLPFPQTAGETIAELLENASGGRSRDLRYHLRVLREQKVN